MERGLRPAQIPMMLKHTTQTESSLIWCTLSGTRVYQFAM
jgi:hypothetical protein